MRVFTEIQRFPRWIQGIIALFLIVAVYLGINAYLNVPSKAQKDEMLLVLLIIVVVGTFTIFFIASIRQEVRIDETGLYYKYPPFKRKEVHIPILNIKHYDLVNYTNFYYGYRIGFWNVIRREPSITVAGIRKAVRIGFRNGKTLLIGTRKPDELLKALNAATQKQEHNEIY